MSRLVTALTRLLNIRVPLLNAPMMPYAGGALAAAVCAAGGFGMLAVDESDSREQVEEQAALIRPHAFGIGLTH